MLFTHCASLHYAVLTLAETISSWRESSCSKQANSYDFFCFQLKLHGPLILTTCCFNNNNENSLKGSTICTGYVWVFFFSSENHSLRDYLKNVKKKKKTFLIFFLTDM